MIYEYWLANLTKIRSNKRIAASEMLGGARKLYLAGRKELNSLEILTDEEISMILEAKKSSHPQEAWEAFNKTGIQFIPYFSGHFPQKLLNIYQQPYALFVKGALPENRKSVAVVGARMCSEYGRSIAEKIGFELAACGVQVISGMALGIDSASHAGALKAGGKTFAILGCGCDNCYPSSSRNIYKNILDSGGGIISEYPPGSPPLTWHFPERNRLISGLADAVAVIEAKEKSGSLITADHALDQGRDVYAVPGRIDDILSRGCNRLIAQGAGIICDTDSLLINLGLKKTAGKQKQNISEAKPDAAELKVLDYLDLHPVSMETILEMTGLNLLEALNILENLKQKGLVRESRHNYYCRCLR